MGLNRRKFMREFKEAAVRPLELGGSAAEMARACEVNANVLHRWSRELREFGRKEFTGPDRNRADENRIAALERKVGQQRVEEHRTQQALATRGSSAPTSKSK